MAADIWGTRGARTRLGAYWEVAISVRILLGAVTAAFRSRPVAIDQLVVTSSMILRRGFTSGLGGIVKEMGGASVVELAGFDQPQQGGQVIRKNEELWLLRAPANAFGVTAVVPYYARENAQPF